MAARADTYEDIRYEGFGPGGVGVIVEVLTDNRNRAAANVRAVFTRNGGNLGETGSVAFMFDRLGQIAYGPEAGTEYAVIDAAIEAGAEDVASQSDGHVILTAFEDMTAVAEGLEAKLGAPISSSIIWRPKTTVPIDGMQGASLAKLLEALEDEDEVQSVWTNALGDTEDSGQVAG